MRDAHGFIFRKVDAQPMGYLLRRPAIDPFAVTPMWLVPAFEGRVRRPDNLTAIGVMHLAFQPVLNVAPKSRVSH